LWFELAFHLNRAGNSLLLSFTSSFPNAGFQAGKAIKARVTFFEINRKSRALTYSFSSLVLESRESYLAAPMFLRNAQSTVIAPFFTFRRYLVQFILF